MSRQTRKLSHHKSRHNGRRRQRNGDIFQPRPSRVYRRPCGCSKLDIARKNKIMMKIILVSKPDCKWDGHGWSFYIPSKITKKFGRCVRHLSDSDKTLLEERGLTV
jgi:hypothetical protein